MSYEINGAALDAWITRDDRKEIPWTTMCPNDKCVGGTHLFCGPIDAEWYAIGDGKPSEADVIAVRQEMGTTCEVCRGAGEVCGECCGEGCRACEAADNDDYDCDDDDCDDGY